MKTLVIHPQDPTTDFLKVIYEDLGFTVISQKISDDDLAREIKRHDRVFFLGHGCSWGLLGWANLVFYDDLVYALNNNPHNIFIWCYADVFVSDNRLLGFHTGMFISEMKEAVVYNVSTDKQRIDYSNNLFATTLREVIDVPEPTMIYEHVKTQYQSETCPVIRFNNERLYFGSLKEDRAAHDLIKTSVT